MSSGAEAKSLGSTDTGDYFPEGYNPEEEIAFSSGMMGSQAGQGGNRDGPQLPGLENLGADAVVAGGITVDENIPAGPMIQKYTIWSDHCRSTSFGGASSHSSNYCTKRAASMKHFFRATATT